MVNTGNALLVSLHEPLLNSILRASRSVKLCSPFLSGGTALLLADLAQRQPSVEWHLLTSLSPRAVAHGSLSTDGLRKLRQRGVRLRHLESLHAKAFVVDDTAGFVGSANLTASGLGSEPRRRNHELTVALDDSQRIEAERLFDGWWQSAIDISPAMLRDCERAARRVKVTVEEEPSEQDGELLAEAELLLEQSRQCQCWVKAEYQDAASADRPRIATPFVASPNAGRPAFEPGDLLLLYAKQTGKCNTVVEVAGASRKDAAFLANHGIPPEHVTRWPWVTPVKPRMQVPTVKGVPLERLGITGQSLQPGHRRLPVGAFAAAVQYLCGTETADI